MQKMDSVLDPVWFYIIAGQCLSALAKGLIIRSRMWCFHRCLSFYLGDYPLCIGTYPPYYWHLVVITGNPFKPSTPLLTSSGGHRSWLYFSYLNAFLLLLQETRWGRYSTTHRRGSRSGCRRALCGSTSASTRTEPSTTGATPSASTSNQPS